jgi:hypothetical protein
MMVALGVVAAVPGAAQTTRPRARDSAPAAACRDPRADLFVQRGCTACHAISALGATASADVGPDLTYAYADVVTRYGVNLEYFLFNPVGVMRMMLGAHLHLSAADRDSMVHILRGLYEERRAEMDEDIPSLPPGRPLPDWLAGRSGRCQP